MKIFLKQLDDCIKNFMVRRKLVMLKNMNVKVGNEEVESIVGDGLG